MTCHGYPAEEWMMIALLRLVAPRSDIVIPTPVIESFSAFKSIGVVFWVIVHHEEDLPLHLHP